MAEEPKALPSDVPATAFALVSGAIAFFPPEQLWSKLAIVLAFVALSAAFLVLKRKESAAQDAAIQSLQKSIDDLVKDLRERERQVLQLQTQNAPRPLVVIEYDCDFERNPEQPFIFHNAGAQPAMNVEISVIQYRQLTAAFEGIPTLPVDVRVERLPDLEHAGLLFRHRLRDLLDQAWGENRWNPALKLSKPEIEKLFDQPVVFPITVTYLDPVGNRYTGEFELVYIYFGARAFVRLRTEIAGAA